MSNNLINLSEFEPILPLIITARIDPRINQIWLEIGITYNFILDIKKCESIFKNDVQLSTDFLRGGFMAVLTGTILSPELSIFFISELNKRGRNKF